MLYGYHEKSSFKWAATKMSTRSALRLLLERLVALWFAQNSW